MQHGHRVAALALCGNLEPAQSQGQCPVAGSRSSWRSIFTLVDVSDEFLPFCELESRPSFFRCGSILSS